MQAKLQEELSVSKIDEYNLIKEELDKIEEMEAKGAILRSRIRWTEAGEKNSKYFLNLEKRNATEKLISQLQLSDGTITCDPKCILNEQRLFYEKLYSQPCNAMDGMTSSDIESVLSDMDINKLTDTQKVTCEGLVTEHECLNALKNMQNGKSPGCDGFTVDFYKFFWKNIKNFLVDSLNFAFCNGELSVDQKRGVITLIPKKHKIRILLKNWRPISLLNTDYKILTKCLAIRLHGVLPSIIDLDQTGYLKGRYIGENIRTIADVIQYTSLKKQPGIVLLLDFEKAFDTIKWSFILKSLQLLNFGECFIKRIEIIYTNIESTVINNGNTCGFFKLHRGIRQGCPVSPYLFIMAVELFAILIRKNRNIKGITVGNTELKISQLADDTTVFLSNFESVRNVLNLAEEFYQMSGLRLNKGKTVAKCIGTLEQYGCNNEYQLLWTKGPIQTLGITISNDADTIMKENFLPRLKVFDNLLNIWHCRGLSLKGKVTVLKSLAVPQLLYPMSVLPIPTEVVNIVDSMINDFMWSKRQPKIRKDVIIQNIENGGIKVPKFATMVEANRMSWIKRLLNDSQAKWKSILSTIIKPFSLEHFIETYLDDENIDSIQIPFYVQLFKIWNKLRPQPQNVEHYFDMVIWKNKFIKQPIGPPKKQCKSVMWNELYLAGIIRIRDVFTNDRDFIDLNDFCIKNDIKFNFIKNIGIRKAIPKQWISAIQQEPDLRKDDCTGCNYTLKSDKLTVDIRYSTAKHVYDVLICKEFVKPTALGKWEEIYHIDENDWSSIFKNPYFCSRETKLQSFQYKIINRIIVCKKWLYNLKVVNSPICTRCSKNTVEDINHLLIECSELENFWCKLENWWNQISSHHIKLSDKHILFGIYYDNKFYKNINFVILLAKWYIYNQAYLDQKVDFYKFLILLKSKVETERFICTRNGQLSKFEKQWTEIIDNL